MSQKPIRFRFIEKKQRERLSALGFSITDIFKLLVGEEETKPLEKKISVLTRGVLRYTNLILSGRLFIGTKLAQRDWDWYYDSSFRREGGINTPFGTVSEQERIATRELLFGDGEVVAERDRLNSIGKYYGIETVTASDALVTFEAGFVAHVLKAGNYTTFLEDCFCYQFGKRNIDSSLTNLILNAKSSEFDIRSVSLYFEKI